MGIILHKPSKEKFVRGYLEKLIEKDADLRDVFDKAESDTERNFLKTKLKESLENSYDTYAKEYFSSKGVGSYVSTFLRAGGGIADAIGTYAFWTLGGAGFGIKGVGLAVKSLADLIDGYHYKKTSKKDEDETERKWLQRLETAVTRSVAYAPLGIGELTDFLRGKSKYDNKITVRALSHAKEYFFDYIKGERERLKIAELKNFRNQDYITQLEEAANQPVEEEVEELVETH